MATGRKPPGKPDASGAPQDYFGSGTFGDDDDPFIDDTEMRLSLASDEHPSGGEAEAEGALDASAFGGAPPEDDDGLDSFESTKASAQSSSMRASATARGPDRRRWPTGKSPDTASLRIDAVEVTVAAGYGPAPTSVALTPLYAARVLLRKRALGAKVKELAESFAQAERQRDELIVGLAQQQRGKILMAETGDKLFEPVVELERVALERRSALAGTSAEFDRRVAEHEAQLESLRKEAAEKAAATAQREASLAEQRRLLERAEAKKKRLYIEVRAIMDVAEKSGGQMSEAQRSKLHELEAEIARQKPELDAATQATQAAAAAATAAEGDEQQVARRIRDAERARRTIDQQSQQEIGTRSQGVSEAEQQRAAALAEVGRAVLAARGRIVDVAPETLDAITRAEEAVERRATELEKFVRALDAHDAGAFKNGLAVTGAALLALVVLIVVLATR